MAIENKIEKFLSEASTASRAWSGKIKHIDSLLSWMYEKNILTKTEKAEKDRIFRQYYRYYNDGDLPDAMRKQGHSLNRTRNMTDTGEADLEKYLEAFIKKILSKYMPKIDRTAFRLEKSIKELSSLKGMIETGDSIDHVLSYWAKDVKITNEDESSKFASLVDQAQQMLNILKEATGNKNLIISRDEMKKSGEWTKDMERYYIELTSLMGKIGNFVGNLLIGFKRALALRNLE